ncbi:unnamed protein product [Acanthocheilonema viteae]|uniref:Uncharacterized protein n=1 Tax=Acanthocheilonema viteae TaxID=6277 RepID=A0A498SQA8_ACAVI|nr:unnamed protein product [Acanthocheilonema viteae]
MEPCENENRCGKRMQNASKIPVVKFTKARGQSISSLLLSRHSDDSEDSGRFAVSFDDSFYANKSEQVEKVNNSGQTCKQSKHSRAQQFLSVFSQPELLSAGTSDRDSIGSSDSSFHAENVSRISAILDKAKSRGRQLVYSHKNKKVTKKTDSLGKVHQIITVRDVHCVEGEIGLQNRDHATAGSISANKDSLTQSSSFFDRFHMFKSADDENNKVPKFEQPRMFKVLISRHQILPFSRHRVLSSLLLLAFN